jgi:hypothetical protein
MPTTNDPALYTTGADKDKILLGLYVDDLVIASKNLSSIEKVKFALHSTFEMADIREAKKVLGIELTRNKEEGWIFMGQGSYAREVLKRFNMEACKPKTTPLDVNQKLTSDMAAEMSQEEKEIMERTPYREAVGSLMYLMVSTRPDLAAAVQIVSRFATNPAPAHWKAVQRVLQYLQYTKDHGIKFQKQGNTEITGYCDSDWAGCNDTRRSTTGYLFKLGGAAISWCSRRQKSVALSSCEAEYMSACEATKEACWEKNLVEELGFQHGSIPVMIDNQSAIALIQNPVFHSRTKHIGVRHHFVREKVQDGSVKFTYCPTEAMIADSLTKPVPTEKTEYCRREMGVEEMKKHVTNLEASA